METLRVLLIGDSQVGKTSLLTRFVSNQFTPQVSTIGVDFRVRVCETDRGPIRFQVWDTAGQERFRCITKAYFRGADVIAMVYDVSQPETLQALDYWYTTIQDIVPEVSLIVIGNKREGDSFNGNKGREWSNKRNILYAECSAKQNLNVEETFQQIGMLPRIQREPRTTLNIEPEECAKVCCPIL